VGHLCLCTVICLTQFIKSIAVLENVIPDAGLPKRVIFSTLNVDLSETRNQTQSTSEASSGNNRSAIHYTIPTSYILSHSSQAKNNLQHSKLFQSGRNQLSSFEAIRVVQILPLILHPLLALLQLVIKLFCSCYIPYILSLFYTLPEKR
jgi:hypothetical protein